MGYGRAWVELGFGLGHLLTRGMGAPPTTQTHAHWVWWGLGWGHEFALAIESLPCHLLARPTPGFKPTPMGPRPNPSPRVVAWAFSANPRPNLSPIPHSLIC
ncbi:hypothetical protein Hanom_Chr11g01009161 [Helianthus anomalus]